MSHCTTFAEAGRLVDAGRRAPFLLTLCEEDENELHITICCAKAEPNAQTPSTGNAALDHILAHCTPMCPDENAKIELIFGKDEVGSSNLPSSSKKHRKLRFSVLFCCKNTENGVGQNVGQPPDPHPDPHADRFKEYRRGGFCLLSGIFGFVLLT